MSARIVASVAVGALVLVVACSRRPADACAVDIDCPVGSFCRSGECAVVATDGGVEEGGNPVACVSPGANCSVDSDCCTPPCNTQRVCAGVRSGGTSGTSGTSGASGTSGTSGTTSSGSSCVDLYGLCSFDGECCTGLACDPTTNSCR